MLYIVVTNLKCLSFFIDALINEGYTSDEWFVLAR